MGRAAGVEAANRAAHDPACGMARGERRNEMKNWFIVAAPLVEPLPTVDVIRATIKARVGEVVEALTVTRPDAIPTTGEYHVYLPPVTSMTAESPGAKSARVRKEAPPHNAIIAGTFATESVALAACDQLNADALRKALRREKKGEAKQEKSEE